MLWTSSPYIPLFLPVTKMYHRGNQRRVGNASVNVTFNGSSQNLDLVHSTWRSACFQDLETEGGMPPPGNLVKK